MHRTNESLVVERFEGGISRASFHRGGAKRSVIARGHDDDARSRRKLTCFGLNFEPVYSGMQRSRMTTATL
jgi:hypothetical protein